MGKTLRNIAIGTGLLAVVGLSGCIMHGSPAQVAEELPKVPEKFFNSVFGKEEAMEGEFYQKYLEMKIREERGDYDKYPYDKYPIVKNPKPVHEVQCK